MTKQAWDLLAVLFGEQSNLQLPVSTAAQVLEIRQFVAQQNALKVPVSHTNDCQIDSVA